MEQLWASAEGFEWNFPRSLKGFLYFLNFSLMVESFSNDVNLLYLHFIGRLLDAGHSVTQWKNKDD